MNYDPTSKLAIHGGEPTFPDGPPSWPAKDPSVRQALLEAYEAGHWGQYNGPLCEELKQDLCTAFKVEDAHLCCSGTFAVELALRGLKIGEEDEVILAGYDFPGNFRCIDAVGARPVLVDINPSSWCIDIDMIAEAASDKTRAVIVSHLHGGLAPMESVSEIASNLGIHVVEDACQAPGAIVDGKPAGSWGDVGVLSFGGSKLLSAGRGGAVLTNRPDVLQRMKIFCERGNDAFPLSELQAAVLLPQLASLDSNNSKRLANVRLLKDQGEKWPALRMVEISLRGDLQAFYKVAMSYHADGANCDRETFAAAVRAEGIALDPGFRGFTKRSAKRCRTVGELQRSEAASQNTLLLHHPMLLETPEIIQKLSDGIAKVQHRLTRSSD